MIGSRKNLLSHMDVSSLCVEYSEVDDPCYYFIDGERVNQRLVNSMILKGELKYGEGLFPESSGQEIFKSNNY